MTTDYMGTCMNTKWHKAQFWQLIEDQDIHKWIVGFEVGKKGKKHLQFRIRLTENDEKVAFCEIKQYLPDAWLAKCSDSWNYERKSGRFLSSEDTPGAKSQRFGKLKGWQKTCIDNLESQNDRAIDVYVNESGGIGKSWLAGHLWETAQAHVVQAQNTAKGLIQDCASEFIHNGNRPILVIDIPRTWKWTDDIYVAIERIKDGLIKDTRYGSTTINIHGTKLLVFCNTGPNEKKLSLDRWRIFKI